MIAFDYCHKEGQFDVKFKSISRKPLSWKKEVVNTVKTIVSSTDKPLYVFMSGGIDSELVAHILLQNGIKFKALVLKHKNNTNGHDTIYADMFCEKNNIEQVVVDFDIKEFDYHIEKYINQGYRSTNIYHYLQLILLQKVESLGGFGIGGAGEQIYYTIDDVVHIKINPSYVLGVDWCKRNNIWHQFWFYNSNPELFASYLQLDLIKFLLNDPSYFKNHHYASIEKMILIHKEWPEIERRNKYNGFENFEKNYKLKKENELKRRFPDIVDLYIPISTVKKQLNYE